MTMPRLVGVIHLPPLPGSPRAREPMSAVVAGVTADARALATAGFDLVMVENFGDAPFHRGAAPPVTVAAMTACALAAREALPPAVGLGINVLRNDALSAVAIAHVVGAQCLRVNVLTGARVTDQGIIEGDAATLQRERKNLGAQSVAVWADVDVKHSAALAPRDLAAEAKDTVLRALADVLLVTGEGTGVAVDEDRLRRVRAAVPGTPVLVASGATVAALPKLGALCDGVIVGSALRRGGIAGGRIDASEAAGFAKAFRKAFGG